MTAQPSLTAELRAEVKALETDLRVRLVTLADVNAAWREQHKAALACGRTGLTWQEWSEERITQAAVAWVLTTVFIRFAEDNALVGPVWISGPKPRRAEVLNAQTEFLRVRARAGEDPTDRDWLYQAIDHFKSLPATEGLVDEKSALWLVTPSGDAASRLLTFWRDCNDDGELLRDLHDSKLETRFLGDIYQDLSEEAKSRYALLQTPAFVEKFILDRTLEPALNERPLNGFKVIDPTCGSGHFLLGAFARLLERWTFKEPGSDSRARTQKALDAIYGVDLNPFAVAIARFRLTIAAMQASGDKRLEDAPLFAYHLAVGDSLLHGLDQGELDLGHELGIDRVASDYAYPTENLASLGTILANGSYDAVVGNPPYITVKDKSLNQEYRRRYLHLKRKYPLTVPFVERFFALAKAGERPGWVGQILSNSFMRRDSGKSLVENFLPRKDLQLLIDSEGAWIPGHNMDGTPTVIVIGINRPPTSSKVRSVLGKGRRESRTSGAEGGGPYWSSIVNRVDQVGFENDWVSIADLDRSLLAKHPWSLSGGGMGGLLSRIEDGRPVARRDVRRAGFFGVIGADEVMLAPSHSISRRNVEQNSAVRIIVGEEIRDWRVSSGAYAFYPYDDAKTLLQLESIPLWARWLWPYQVFLGQRATFGGGTYFGDGRPWWEWHQLPKDEDFHHWAIVHAEVATHNHFVLVREGVAMKQTAPLMKLSRDATEQDHLGLLGVLNSSIACCWLRERTKPKGGGADVQWLRTYQFNATKVQEMPLPPRLPHERGRTLDEIGRQLSRLTPEAVVASRLPTRQLLNDVRRAFEDARARMIAEHEELDWELYYSYGLLDENLTYNRRDLPSISSSGRAFAILMARRASEEDEVPVWFRHEAHRFSPMLQLPHEWPQEYRDLVTKRISLIESHPFLALLERPESKRRWELEEWEAWEERALRDWLLDRLEGRHLWFDGSGIPTPRSIMQLADEMDRDLDFISVLQLWERRPDVQTATSLQKLLGSQAVPFLAAYRYTEAGMRKREAWELSWSLQRRRDAGDRTSNIPSPPEFKFQGADKDFSRKEYWDHRGKLDVPKERFVLYPDAGRDVDPTPVLGWAGWDHAQQAFAIDQLLQQREAEGWEDKRLIPLVAGLAELLPWVEQWHTEPDDFYGGASPADFFREQLTDRSRQVEQTREQLAAWRPEPTKRGRKTAAK